MKIGFARKRGINRSTHQPKQTHTHAKKGLCWFEQKSKKWEKESESINFIDMTWFSEWKNHLENIKNSVSNDYDIKKKETIRTLGNTKLRARKIWAILWNVSIFMGYILIHSSSQILTINIVATSKNSAHKMAHELMLYLYLVNFSGNILQVSARISCVFRGISKPYTFG